MFSLYEDVLELMISAAASLHDGKSKPIQGVP